MPVKPGKGQYSKLVNEEGDKGLDSLETKLQEDGSEVINNQPRNRTRSMESDAINNPAKEVNMGVNKEGVLGVFVFLHFYSHVLSNSNCLTDLLHVRSWPCSASVIGI